ncbi:MAG: uncharacterized protein JWM74_3519 [Myxococcaceae bacterium]|nr:uncharacterized protein [Myxococcaceae bacterium]
MSSRPVDWRRVNYVLVPYFTRWAARQRSESGSRKLPRGLWFFVLAAERVTVEGAHLAALMFLAAPVALDVRRNHLYLAWAAITGLLLASILVSRALRLQGVRARVVAPRRVMVGEAIELRVQLVNEGDTDHVSLRARGPFLSWDGEWLERARGLRRLAAGQTRQLVFRARFLRRGHHHIGSFRVQALVPFGLAMGPPVRTEATRLLVVPRVANVTELVLAEPRRHHKGGVPRAAQHADSRELAGVRPYRPGDPVKDLHARTWARTGVPFVREYQEEFFAHVGVWVDTACGDVLGGSGPKAERQAEARLEGGLSLAAGIVARLLCGEALIDLFVAQSGASGAASGGASADRDAPLALGHGRGTLDAALDVLAAVEAQPAFDTERVQAAIEPHAAELSALIAIVPTWDEPRRAMIAKLVSAGLACRVLVLDPSCAASSGEGQRIQILDPAAILRGDPVT